jgi:hypothetical protein
MITLLSLLLLFTLVQEQVTSVTSVNTPPVEVLNRRRRPALSVART